MHLCSMWLYSQSTIIKHLTFKILLLPVRVWVNSYLFSTLSPSPFHHSPLSSFFHLTRYPDHKDTSVVVTRWPGQCCSSGCLHWAHAQDGVLGGAQDSWGWRPPSLYSWEPLPDASCSGLHPAPPLSRRAEDEGPRRGRWWWRLVCVAVHVV